MALTLQIDLSSLQCTALQGHAISRIRLIPTLRQQCYRWPFHTQWLLYSIPWDTGLGAVMPLGQISRECMQLSRPATLATLLGLLVINCLVTLSGIARTIN